ncbi:MAG: flagellar hook protein FlgE [Rhizomicrobium sp.]
MSLYDAMMIGVAGLDANSRALSIYSSNIANVNTVGYKTSSSAFATMLASATGTQGASDSSVMANAQQNIVQQGLLTATSSPTDLAISGNGFFQVSSSPSLQGQPLYTRAGSFQPDAAGNLENTAGLYLMGWPITNGGAPSTDPNALQAINLSNLSGKGEATTKMSLQQNLQASATEDDTYTAGDMTNGVVQPDFTRTINVYDSQGGSQPLQISYIKTGPNQWGYEVSYQGTAGNITGSNPISTGTLQFDSNGALVSTTDTTGGGSSTSTDGSANITIPWDANSGLQPQTINLDFGTPGKSDGTSQFDTASVMTNSNVDGAVFGDVTGVKIGSDGTVNAIYSNGLSEAVFKIPLVTFANADGLSEVSGNAFAQTSQSGTPMVNDAGTGGSGTIASSALEGSTVDLATEFTNMITTQRAYSASARVVTTASQMLDTLMQMQG